MKTARIPTILGLAVLMLALAIGVMIINNQQVFLLRADPVANPKHVRISNVTDSSFTVSWVTDSPSTGYIRLSDSRSLFPKVYLDTRPDARTTHYIQVSEATPSRTYTFDIVSNNTEYTNRGLLWKVTTLAEKIPTPIIISGKVEPDELSPVVEALVYLSIDGKNYQATLSDSSGVWFVPFPETSITSPQELEVVVQTSPTRVGVAHAMFTGKELLIPAISLGDVQTFTDIDLEILTTAPPAKL